MVRPLVTFDLDGVLCRPPFGINPGTGRGKRRNAPGRRGILWFTERWRYVGRKPMPGALPALKRLETACEWSVVTARSEKARGLTESWFRKHYGVVPPLRMRTDWRSTSAQFKVAELSSLAPAAHFEDDPFTAAWLADAGIRVFLVSWPRNEGLAAPGITRVSGVKEGVSILLQTLSAIPDV